MRTPIDRSVVIDSAPDLLERLGDRLDRLHSAIDAPVTSRRTWMQVWADSRPDQQLVGITTSPHKDRLEGAVILAVSTRNGVRRLVGVGDGTCDALVLAAGDAGSADLLTGGMLSYLSGLAGPWSMRLRHVLPGDLVAPRLAQRWPYARLRAGGRSPMMYVQGRTSLAECVSRSHEQRSRRMQNRLGRESVEFEVQHTRDATELDALQADVEAVYRARDADLGRSCDLDRPGGADFFRRLIRLHAERGEVCLTTMHLDASLAAYVLCFDDGGIRRMWNCRFDPRWARYSPGRLAMDAAVDRAVTDGCAAFDFMWGEERYKASYATDTVQTQDLHAYSGPFLQAGGAATEALRQTARRLDERGGRASRVVAWRRRHGAKP